MPSDFLLQLQGAGGDCQTQDGHESQVQGEEAGQGGYRHSHAFQSSKQIARVLRKTFDEKFAKSYVTLKKVLLSILPIEFVFLSIIFLLSLDISNQVQTEKNKWTVSPTSHWMRLALGLLGLAKNVTSR
jgi:hypothetical protein